MKPKPVMQNSTIFWILGLLAIVVLLIGQYMFKVHVQNEARGYCSEADKILSEDEMRRRIMLGYIKETIQRDIETTSYNQELSFYISKYNLKDSEEIIDIMRKSKLNNSFEYNFGIIAAAYMSEYRDVLRSRPVEFQSSPQIHRLTNKFAEIDIDYLSKLPNNYTFIIQWDGVVIILPKSLIRRIDSKTYNMYFFRLEVACCDADYIKIALKDQEEKERYFIEEGKPLVYAEPKININEIDGKIIDGVFFSKAYDKVILTNLEQVRNMNIYSNIANLRSVLVGYPMLERRTVTACGDLQPLERKMSAKRIEQDIFKWLRKAHLKLTTSPQ